MSNPTADDFVPLPPTDSQVGSKPVADDFVPAPGKSIPDAPAETAQTDYVAASQGDSSQVNKVSALAKKTGLDPRLVSNNTDAVEKASMMPDMDEMQRLNPITASWLANSPANVAASHADVDNLSKHEAVLSQGEHPNIFKQFFRYLTEAPQIEQVAQAQNVMQMARVTGKPATAEEQVPFARSMGAATQPTGGELAAGAMTVGMGAGLAEAGIAGAGATVGAKAVASYIGKTALTVGAFEGLNKLVPTEKFIPTDANDITKTAIEAADFIVKGAIAGGVTGAIRPIGEFIKAKFDDMGIKLPKADEAKIINTSLNQMPGATTTAAPSHSPIIQTLGVLAKESKLAKEAPEIYADHVQTVADQYDKGTISIPEDELNKYFQDKGIDHEAEKTKLGAVTRSTMPEDEINKRISEAKEGLAQRPSAILSGWKQEPLPNGDINFESPTGYKVLVPKGKDPGEYLAGIREIEKAEYGKSEIPDTQPFNYGIREKNRDMVSIPTGKFLSTYSDTEHINGLAKYSTFEPTEAPEYDKVDVSGRKGVELPDYNKQVGEAIKSPEPQAVGDIGKTDNPIKNFLKISQKEREFTGNLEADRYALESAGKIDRIHAMQIIGGASGTPADYEAIYHYAENNKEPLTDFQKKLYENEIKPLMSEADDARAQLKGKEVSLPPSEYMHRIVADRGGTIERLRAGFKNISEGGMLRKSVSSLKSRVMYALEDEEGNRKVVSIKGGDVTGWGNKIPEWLGKERRPAQPKVTEYFDKSVRNSLDKVLYDLGIKHERVLKDSDLRGNRMGVALTGENLIKTKVATPEAVILHEIGHKLDEKYNLQDEMFGAAKGIEPTDLEQLRIVREEARKLADLKYAGQEENVSKYFKSSVRKGGEKIAGMFEAYLQAPDKFKEVAPNLYDKFSKFLESKPELKPILDIKPSMVYDSRTYGGPQEPNTFIDKNGKKWNIKDATTKEIEANTSIKYHKNALVTSLINYVDLRKAQRSVEFMDKLKESPEFNNFALKLGTEEYNKSMLSDPKGIRESSVPQLRGYAFPNRIANALDDFYKKGSTSNVAETYSKINGVLRNAIFFNPLIHIPNILNHWAVNRGTTPWFKPGDYGTLSRSTARAFAAVSTLNQDYLDVMEKGGNLMYSEVLNEKLSEKLLNIAGQQLESDKGTLAKIGKELGYANPANLVKAIYNFSSKATWATNDFATLQAVFEGMEHGKSMEAAIGEVSKHIPNYRIPSEVMGSRFISSIMRGESGLTMFGSYHYGALKSYGEMLSDVKKGLTGEDPQKAAEALDKISALVIATYFVYPQLDNIAQYVTGNPNASVKRAGASTFLYNSQQFAQKAMSHRGATSADVSQFVQRTIAPSIGLTAGMELYYGRDMHNGRAFNYGQKMASYISPLDYGMKVYQGKKSPSATGWGLMSINSPKHAYK